MLKINTFWQSCKLCYYKCFPNKNSQFILKDSNTTLEIAQNGATGLKFVRESIHKSKMQMNN